MNDWNDLAQEWDSAQSTFAAYCARRHVPLRGTFELTPRCNFKCKMCYIHQTPVEIAASLKRELTTSQWIHLAEEAIKAGTLNLMLTGGEPMLRDDFEEIYTEINKMGFILSLNTNASLVDKHYFDLFSKYPPTAVSVTLYGADRETYGRISGNPDFYDQTIRGLEYLSELPTSLDIKATFIQDNKGQLDALREVANCYTDAFAINYTVFKPIPGVKSEAEACRLSAKESIDIDINNRMYYTELEKGLDRHIADAPRNGEAKANAVIASGRSQSSPMAPSRISNKPRDYGIEAYPEILTCLSAKAAYWLTWDGRMLPCATFDGIATEPLKEGFWEAWERLPGLFQGMRQPAECLACEFFENCPNCPAYFQMETGSYDTVSTYICELAKERNRRRA